jgi:hypothetical protein
MNENPSSKPSKNRRPVTTMTTHRPGRPKSIRRKVERMLGTACMAALDAEDLHVVPGHMLRELCIITGEPAPAAKAQATPPSTQPETTGTP